MRLVLWCSEYSRNSENPGPVWLDYWRKLCEEAGSELDLENGLKWADMSLDMDERQRRLRSRRCEKLPEMGNCLNKDIKEIISTAQARNNIETFPPTGIMGGKELDIYYLPTNRGFGLRYVSNLELHLWEVLPFLQQACAILMLMVIWYR